MSLEEQVLRIATLTHDAAREAAILPMSVKEKILRELAAKLREKRRELQQQNAEDVRAAKDKGISAAMIDRLTLSDKVIEQTAAGLEEIAAFPDPVGEVVRMWTRPNGMRVGRMRIPLGVIGIIYESRPNVTADAGALCLKAGNAVILRGGSEAHRSNQAIVNLFKETLKENGVNEDVVNLLPTTDRDAILHMLKLEELIDLIIPRGGEELIRFVAANSRIPVIKHYKGVCHLYVDKEADLEMAVKLTVNSKAQRPGVCNALETLLVHKDIAARFLPVAADSLGAAGVELRGCDGARAIVNSMKVATEDDWYAEYLDLILAVKVVDSIDAAISHIAKYGSLHTESIVTRDYEAAQKFLKEVNSSSVIVNAATRMSDGYVYGLGAEIGISTTKIHSYGPMGVEDLTTTKFIVLGEGQIRE
ncbi:glutamate-5-semialdehyde dehydrogenase [Desulfomonile tiedjei]|uniref:Gamma-glutamyl phosphate reductase n=1 Tax=Desulfomonile tiedjei (strain ATCC 49306 / DSM 6799 / DCB-1) TaxID=706587 RepID=I4C2M0_DESTA|nr:glutamate-5-semialdehyde dehydrogenase [Desulfomonile tiedjei]AFM23811.1 glutamate-5-semialdehyde dehydrogenase [Desulfomonile tiedjei DSM 6799]